MLRYILKRLLAMIPLLFAITIVTFILMDAAPGSPASMYQNPDKPFMTQEEIDAIEHKLGVDQPVYIQYIKWLKELLHGNLGYSYDTKQPVWDEMMRASGITIQISFWALVLALVGGLAIGIFSALHQYKFTDHFISVLTFIGISVPGFWLALLLILLFSLKLGWLPFIGLHSANKNLTGWAYTWDYIKHLILPIFVQAIGSMASWVRYERSAFLEVINQDYIRTAMAKGLSRRDINWKHAFRNSALPIVTLLGGSLSGLFGGAFLIENVFSIPGMGRLGTMAITQKDYPMIMGTILFSSVLVLIGYLLSDILYCIVDPRIRFE